MTVTDNTSAAVPREPTAEMVEAAIAAMGGNPMHSAERSVVWMVWQAMHDAAPRPALNAEVGEIVGRAVRSDIENGRWTDEFFDGVSAEAVLWMAGKREPFNADFVHSLTTYARRKRDEVAALLAELETLSRATCNNSLQVREEGNASVFEFLLGEGPLDGCQFGEKPEGERGNFWWRKHLRAALDDLREEGSCVLCAGKCRGHSMGHPEQWIPEPGSHDGLILQGFREGVEAAAKVAAEAENSVVTDSVRAMARTIATAIRALSTNGGEVGE